MPDQPNAPSEFERLDIVRNLMPFVLFGVIVVLLALLLIRWPSAAPDDSPISTSAHLNRVISRLAGTGGPVLPGLVLDLGIYAAALLAVVLMVAAWRSGARRALVGLVLIGLLGLSYAGGMALYSGAMFGVCGFTLILAGGLVAWIATSPDDAAEMELEAAHAEHTEMKDKAFSQPEAATESDAGKNDYASHPVT